MADWPVGPDIQKTNTPSATIIRPVGSGTAHTKGPWSQIIASTPFASEGFMLFTVGGGADCLLDIGIGAAGSEVVLISNILLDAGGGTLGPSPVFVPMSIPAGARISTRAQRGDTGTGSTAGVSIILLGGGFAHSIGDCQKATTWGAVTATTRGTVPGADPTWVQYVASTPHPIRWLGIVNDGFTANLVGSNGALDIGIGAAGSEVVVVSDFLLSSEPTSDWIYNHINIIPLSLPAGVRIAARSNASPPGDVVLIGFI